jgi:hypothetical protein
LSNKLGVAAGAILLGAQHDPPDPDGPSSLSRDITGTESVQDFVARLAEQLAFLDASADAYDRGVESEAIRLAATIRVLVHDGRPPSRSLLSHLQVRDRPPWTETAAGEIRESALSVGSGLSMMRMSTDGSATSSFQPSLGQLPPERIHPAAGSSTGGTIPSSPTPTAPPTAGDR